MTIVLDASNNPTTQVLSTNYNTAIWHHFILYVTVSTLDITLDRVKLPQQQLGVVPTGPTDPRSWILASPSFNGYLKELRVYTDFSVSDSHFWYLLNKNYKSSITNPTNYPYLSAYYRLTGDSNYNDPVFHLLAELTLKNNGMVTMSGVIKHFLIHYSFRYLRIT